MFKRIPRLLAKGVGGGVCQLRKTNDYINDFIKSLSCAPVKDITKFTRSFLQEKPIEIEDLVGTISSLEEATRTYQRLESKLKLLKDVEERTNDYLSAKTMKETREAVIAYAKICLCKENIEHNEKLIKEQQTSKEICQTKILNLKESIKNIEEEIRAINSDSSFKDTNSQLEVINRQLSDITKGIEKATDSLKLTINEKSKILKIHSLLDNIKEIENFELFDGFNELCEKTLSDLSLVKNNINYLINTLKLKRDEVFRKKLEYENEIDKIKAERIKLNSSLRNLKNGIKEYPKETEKLKSEIEKAFKKEGIDSDVKILADLVESIKLFNWQPAIESYLGKKRFAIIVEPEYILKAQQIQKELKLTSAVLIATNKLPDIKGVNENSLFSILSITNIYAQKYLCYCLNNVIMCNDIRHITNNNISIMEDGFIYKGYSTGNIRLTDELYFGKDAIKKRIDKIEQEIKDLETNLQQLSRKHKELENILGIFDSLKYHDIDVEAYDILNRKKEEEISKKELIDKLKNDNSFKDTILRKESLEKEKEDNENKKDKLIKQQQDIENGIINLNRLIEDNKKNIPIFTDEYEEKLQIFELDRDIIQNDKYSLALKRSGSINAIVNDSKALSQYNSNLDSRAKDLRSSMSRYTKENSDISVLCEADNYKVFLDKYSEIKDVKIEEAKQKICIEREHCVSIFKNELIGQLREFIDESKRLISLINKQMKDAFFEINEEEYYHVSIEKTKTDILSDIYDIIMNKSSDIPILANLDGTDNLIDEKINELIDKIMSKDASALNEFKNEICDYRNYLDCDIFVINEQAGTKISMKAKGNTNSGYEIQSPYYIILAISILQNKRDSNSLGLMVIDEAFAKLDKPNIQKIMNFLSKQELQLIMAAPPEKLDSFENYLDETVPLVKTDKGIVSIGDIHYF